VQKRRSAEVVEERHSRESEARRESFWKKIPEKPE
jgi:hypothetical protein